MDTRIVLLATAAVLSLTLPAQSQPAPKRDLSGVWQPARSIEGIQPNGALNMPADGKPEHDLHLTPYGLELAKTHKSSNGTDPVNPTEENDPAHVCDPQGFPREELFEMRATEILQTPNQVAMLYTYGRVWRIIWTDGRALPADPDPHWYGYSVGKWEGNVFVVQSKGFDDRSWLDADGHPHSEDMQLEERYRRTDHNTIELSMTLTDPTAYTKPWVSEKFTFKMADAKTEMREDVCVPSVEAKYKETIREPAGGAAVVKK